MDCKLTIWNYRCFGERQPVSVEFRQGFHAFVGLNNVGKSTLLRFIYEARAAFATLGQRTAWPSLVGSAESHQLNGPTDSLSPVDAFNSRNGRPMRARLELLEFESIDASAVEIHWLEDGRRKFVLPYNLPPGGGWESESGNIIRYRHNNSNILARLDVAKLSQAAQELALSMYFPAFRSPTSGGSGQKWYDISLGSHLITQLRDMETSQNREMRERFQTTESSLGRVLGIPDLRISPVHEQSVINVRANGTSHALHELGSGIGQFIAAATSVAITRPTYLLVDEPEIHLHPSLQVEYLSLLAANTTHGVLFATHALGLARSITPRISLVRRDEASRDSVVLPLEHSSNPVELLGALQYGSYHSVGMRAILLVEGSGDCLVFRQWLRVLGKDTEILVLPLGGKSLIGGKHKQILDDIRRFGSPVWAIIDSEKATPTAELEQPRRDFLDACVALDIHAMATERRATENYFPQEAIRIAFPSASYVQLKPYDSRPSGTWAKDDNWRVARCMTKNELLDTDIGAFLNRL